MKSHILETCMARFGVTYQDVANAVNQLVGQGKQPTIDAIRQFLGTGSSTTIANHLRKWRAEQDGTQTLASQENLPHELLAMIKGLWQRVLSHAEEQIFMVKQTADTETTQLKQALEKYKNNNQRWQKLHNQWLNEKEQLTNDKLTLEQGIIALQKECATKETKQEALIQQLQEKQDRIHELHRLQTQAQANLEHYRESMREQRLIEQQQFEQEKQNLQIEIKQIKEQIMVLREKITTEQQRYQHLHQAHQNLEQQIVQSQMQTEQLKQQLIAAENMKEEYCSASKHWQGQYQDAQNQLETQTRQLLETQSESKMLSQQLTAIKETLDETLAQNKQLGHEKWILAQEKAQLEGQLKQLMAMMKGKNKAV